MSEIYNISGGSNGTLIFNGTTITDVIYNGVSLNSIIYNGVQVFNKISPSDFTFIDYIYTTGTQYINTGVIPTQGMKFEADVAYLSPSDDAMLCGCRVDGYSTRFFPMSHVGSRFSYGSGRYYYISGTTGNITTAQRYSISVQTTPLSTWYYTIDGNTMQVSASNYSSTIPMYLFANNYLDSMAFNLCKARLHSFKIYDTSSNLIRNYVPCYRNSDSKVGLFDLVNNTFNPSAEGEFYKGTYTKVVDLEQSPLETSYNPGTNSKLFDWTSSYGTIDINKTSYISGSLYYTQGSVSFENKKVGDTITIDDTHSATITSIVNYDDKTLQITLNNTSIHDMVLQLTSISQYI